VSLDLGLDPSRVVACGFSIGGYTAAALCGARVLRPLFEALVSGQIPLPPVPEYPDLARELRQRWERDPDGLLAGCEADVSDARVRAAVCCRRGSVSCSTSTPWSRCSAQSWSCPVVLTRPHRPR
jgi:predicted dienelactone hydrolase